MADTYCAIDGMIGNDCQQGGCWLPLPQHVLFVLVFIPRESYLLLFIQQISGTPGPLAISSPLLRLYEGNKTKTVLENNMS